MVKNRKKTQKKYPSNHSLSHEHGSERSEQVGERVSAAERACEASRAVQANEWAVRVNEQKDERVTQYFILYFWRFWTMVWWYNTRRADFYVAFTTQTLPLTCPCRFFHFPILISAPLFFRNLSLFLILFHFLSLSFYFLLFISFILFPIIAILFFSFQSSSLFFFLFFILSISSQSQSFHILPFEFLRPWNRTKRQKNQWHTPNNVNCYIIFNVF